MVKSNFSKAVRGILNDNGVPCSAPYCPVKLLQILDESHVDKCLTWNGERHIFVDPPNVEKRLDTLDCLDEIDVQKLQSAVNGKEIAIKIGNSKHSHDFRVGLIASLPAEEEDLASVGLEYFTHKECSLAFHENKV